MERGEEMFELRSIDGVRLKVYVDSIGRGEDLILLLGFFEEANSNLTPTTIFQFEISTSPLHMERGGGVLELRSVDGVRLKCSQALEYFSLLLNIVEIRWKT
jgi:hypothetical protein